MKNRIKTILFITSCCIPLTACGGDKKAFEISKEAYANVAEAYKITEQLSSDIYDAWRLGIYDDDELIDGGISYFSKEVSLTEEEIENAIIHVFEEQSGDEWTEMDSDDKELIMDHIFSIMEDDLFSFCVLLVNETYKDNGKMEEAQATLDAAKAQMKELSEKYSDYEHYPSLKEFYTTTNALFDFCKEPTGSFEQLKDTINDYNNDARGYINDLDYIFE